MTESYRTSFFTLAGSRESGDGPAITKVEIQGHTDNTGTDEVNMALGHKRAEGVMMYLYKQHRIPLHRMSVVSMGSSMPIADNGTRDGRAQNRRVEILVYE